MHQILQALPPHQHHQDLKTKFSNSSIWHCVRATHTLTKGFSLIEFLIIMAIISISSLVVFLAIGTVLTKSQTARTWDDFQQIEAALIFYMDSENRTVWWDDNYDDADPICSVPACGGDPFFDQIVITNPEFAFFLSTSPPSAFDGTSAGPALYRYDNDADVVPYDISNCTQTINSAGVNIVLDNVSTFEATAVDTAVDDGDGFTCGKIRYRASDEWLIYNISSGNTF
jgi:type II secretory pathway pseudopilin PulG